MTHKFTIFFLLFNSILLLAQPRLEITPDEIEFEDIFHRNKNVYLINTGNSPLRIDSLVYKNSSYYFLRFDKEWEYPVILQPNDSVKMDCILGSYVYVPAVDTSDTLFIYNSGLRSVEKLKIKIKYYDDDYGESYLTGRVTDGIKPLDSAKVYFFYNNNYIIGSVETNDSGYYNAKLPPGDYAIAIEKDSFYVSFYQNQFDPFNADLIKLPRDSTKIIDLQLDRIEPNGSSISGVIRDSLSLARIKKGVVIVRTGIHTPNKIFSDKHHKILQNGIYSAFIKSDGSYTVPNIINPGYYYIQAFSDYYVPSFFTYANKPAVFWQQADSILVNGTLSNVNVTMVRDSSIGGGKINGTVSANDEFTNLSDLMVIAQSVDNGLLYNYGFLKDNNQFQISSLPYGNYKLFTQKIGLVDGSSATLPITPATTEVNGVNIIILLSSLHSETLIPMEIKLFQNYPNPFNPSTKISWQSPVNSLQTLKIYDVLGNEVATLVNEFREAGGYEVTFDASNLSSGIYYYKIQSGDFVQTKKMMLLK
jgi:hypothetical protein